MGYNKIILCCNDADHEVDKDPVGWWQACQVAFGKLWGSKDPVTFGHGNHVNAWQAVYQGHADQIATIIVGENSASIVDISRGNLNGGYHGDEEVQVQILKEILRRKGYVVYKKLVKQ